ncbi:MAG: sugar-binding protein [bacterium]
MKISLYIFIFSLLFFFINFLVNAQFLPEPNEEQFGLAYGESIAGRPVNPPQIDGKLDDWKYAVWVGFNSANELFRGRGAWKGKDDLSVTWSTMYDDKNFYFSAAVRDDTFAPSDNPAEPWRGDMIFLYIDWAGNKAEVSSKPGFAMIKGKPTVLDFSSGGKNPRLPESKIAIVANPKLGKGGMIYEVEMPFEFLTKETINEGKIVGFTPGYEEGTDNPEGRAGLVFMDWGGIDPDVAVNLGKLKFGGKLLVNSVGKFADSWGRIKTFTK